MFSGEYVIHWGYVNNLRALSLCTVVNSNWSESHANQIIGLGLHVINA
jgi:hypothetical protein